MFSEFVAAMTQSGSCIIFAFRCFSKLAPVEICKTAFYIAFSPWKQHANLLLNFIQFSFSIIPPLLSSSTSAEHYEST